MNGCTCVGNVVICLNVFVYAYIFPHVFVCAYVKPVGLCMHRRIHLTRVGNKREKIR